MAVQTGLPRTAVLQVCCMVFVLLILTRELHAGQDGVILRTTDGGAVWTPQDGGLNPWDYVYSVSFYDADHGSAVVSGAVIITTTDGGANWTPYSVGTWNDLNFVSMTSANSGVAVGFNGMIYKTTNSGTTWESQLQGVSDQAITSVSFADNTHGIAVGTGGVILTTTNAGLNWDSQVSGVTVELYGVSYTDINTATAVGMSGVILRTTDGGINWGSQASGTSENLNSVSFTDADNGTAVGQSGVILRTTNGGTSWETQTSGTTVALWAVAFSDMNNGIAAGNSGTILRTTDGGTTWTPQTSGTNGSIYGACSVDANTYYLSGSTPYPVVVGLILKTTDGGATWSQQNSNTIMFLNSIAFSDADNGITGGLNGVIMHTTDGGADWEPMESNTGAMVRGMYLVDANTGYAVGDNGMILKLGDTPIPVELESFTGQADGDGIRLSWSTATETNNYGFNVERLSNGTWLQLGFAGGSGTTTSRESYSFTDAKPLPGKNYYRLKQTDFDGTFKYSSTIEVSNAGSPSDYNLSQNYPNPFNPATTINYALPTDSHIKILVYNALGELAEVLVNGMKPAGSYSVTWNASKYPSGLYLCKIEASAADGKSNFSSVKKMILMK